MAGRRKTPIGEFGKISRPREIAPGVFEASCRIRDADGVLRRVRARGRSRSAAEAALKRSLVDRVPAEDDLGPESLVDEAAQEWLAQKQALVESGDLAPRTYAAYAASWRNHVAPGMGSFTLREATVRRCEAWQVALRKQVGAPSCKRARAVLGGVLGHAVRMGAIRTNPVRDLSPIPSGSRRAPRALSAAERAAWLAWVDSHPTRPDGTPDVETIARRALGDLSRFMLATGVRVGEALAVGWDDVDLEAGTVHVCHHLVPVDGRGLVRMPGTKRGEGRLLRLPGWAVSMLWARRVASDGAPPVFPTRDGGWRSPVQVSRWIRVAADEAGMPWLTSHSFRRTVITFLDDAGFGTREVADQAGHSRVEQTQGYMARGVVSDRTATALEGIVSITRPS